MASTSLNAKVDAFVPSGAGTTLVFKLNPKADIFGPSNQWVNPRVKTMQAHAGNAGQPVVGGNPVARRLQFGDFKGHSPSATDKGKQNAGIDKGKQMVVDTDAKAPQVAGLADPFGDDKSDGLSAIGKGKNQNGSRRHRDYNRGIPGHGPHMANVPFQHQLSQVGDTIGMGEVVWVHQPSFAPPTMPPSTMLPTMMPYGAVPGPLLFHFAPHQYDFIPGPGSVPVAGGVMVPGLGPIDPLTGLGAPHFHFIPQQFGFVPPPPGSIMVPGGAMIPMVMIPAPGLSEHMATHYSGYLPHEVNVNAAEQVRAATGFQSSSSEFYGPYADQWDGSTTYYPLHGDGVSNEQMNDSSEGTQGNCAGKKHQNGKRNRGGYRRRYGQKDQLQDALSMAHRSQHQELYHFRSNPRHPDGQRQQRNTVLPRAPVQEPVWVHQSVLDAATKLPVADDFGYSKAHDNPEEFDISAFQDAILAQMEADGEPLPGSREFQLEMATGLEEEKQREQAEEVASWLERVSASGKRRKSSRVPSTPPKRQASIKRSGKKEGSSVTPTNQTILSWDDQMDTEVEESVGTSASSPIKAGSDIAAETDNNIDDSLTDATPKAVEKETSPTPKAVVAGTGTACGAPKRMVDDDGSDSQSTSTVVAAEDPFIETLPALSAMATAFQSKLAAAAAKANNSTV